MDVRVFSPRCRTKKIVASLDLLGLAYIFCPTAGVFDGNPWLCATWGDGTSFPGISVSKAVDYVQFSDGNKNDLRTHQVEISMHCENMGEQ